MKIRRLVLIAFLSAMATLAICAALSAPFTVNAQTSTPTLLPTFTPAPTLTPWPTHTPGPSPTPNQAEPTAGFIQPPSFSFEDPSTRIRGELQGAVDVISGVNGTIDTQLVSVDPRTSEGPLTIASYSPFIFFRGLLIIFADFEWLGTLAGWFIFAAFIILAVTSIRLIVSLWGIVDRLIAIIKLIPFI